MIRMQISKDPKTEPFHSEINNVLVFLRQQSHPAHIEHSEQSPKKSCFITISWRSFTQLLPNLLKMVAKSQTLAK